MSDRTTAAPRAIDMRASITGGALILLALGLFFVALAIPSAVLLMLLGLSARQNQLGVIVVPEVALHASPFADSKELGTLEGGQEILLRENKGSWRRVVIADGTSGWLASDRFRSIPTR